MVAASSSAPDPLETAARQLAALPRAESPAERAAILAAADAALAPVRARLADLETALRLHRAEASMVAEADEGEG